MIKQRNTNKIKGKDRAEHLNHFRLINGLSSGVSAFFLAFFCLE